MPQLFSKKWTCHGRFPLRKYMNMWPSASRSSLLLCSFPAEHDLQTNSSQILNVNLTQVSIDRHVPGSSCQWLVLPESNLRFNDIFQCYGVALSNNIDVTILFIGCQNLLNAAPVGDVFVGVWINVLLGKTKVHDEHHLVLLHTGPAIVLVKGSHQNYSKIMLVKYSRIVSAVKDLRRRQTNLPMRKFSGLTSLLGRNTFVIEAFEKKNSNTNTNKDTNGKMVNL